MAAKTIEELLGDYLVFSSRNDPAEIAQFNKVKELLGEVFADIAMDHKFGGQAQAARGVLNRGTKGPPIFDRVYGLGDDRFLLSGEEGLAVIDAKFGESALGRTNLKRSYLVSTEAGKVTKIPLPQKRQVRQLQADWIKDRINELAKAEEKAAAGAGMAKDSLAARLKRSADTGNLQVYEVRTTVGFGEDQVPDVHVEIVDHTEPFRESYTSGRRARADAERVAARKEAIENFYLKASELKAKIDADTYKQARKRLKRAETQVRTAAKDLAQAKRPATQERRQQVLDEKKRAAKDAEAEAKRTQQQAAKSEESAKLNKQLREAQTDKRKAEEAKKRQADRAAKQAEKDRRVAEKTRAAGAEPKTPDTAGRGTAQTSTHGAGTGDAAVSHASTDTTQRGATTAVSDEAKAITRPVGTNAVSARATADTLTEAALQADRAAVSVVKKGAGEIAARQAPRFAERATVRLALKGGRVVYSVGKFAFRVLEIANPILDILLVVDGIDLLVNWLQRDKIENEKQWRRIADFLSSESRTVRLPPYNVPYITSQEASVSFYVGNILSGQIPRRPDDFMAWYHKWNEDTGWRGFVYTTVWINLEQQRVLSGDYPYEYTYWLTNRLDVALSADPPPNTKTDRLIGNVGETQQENRITQGRQAPYADPKYSIAVEIRQLEVRYSYLTPVLTPFDFILVKCNSLVSEIVAFLSRYDENVYSWMDVRSEITPGLMFNWFENYTFGKPIDVNVVRWCLTQLPKVIDWLTNHAPMPGDSIIPKHTVRPKLNTGYHRRFEILSRISGGAGSTMSFRQVASLLNRIVTDENSRYLVTPIDKDLEYLTPEYLGDLAQDIHDDVQLALKACQHPPTDVEYNYQGPPPPQPRGR